MQQTVSKMCSSKHTVVKFKNKKLLIKNLPGMDSTDIKYRCPAVYSSLSVYN